jgi:hypothetical protein
MVALALVLPAVQVCRDWAFIDQNTGSRKGYRDWFFGWRTGSWYRESVLETFMRSRHPGEFQQKWVSYAGTGRNIFGAGMLAGHGRPSRIILLKPEVIDDYCSRASEPEKRRLYDVFASGVPARIHELVDHISETVMNATAEKTEPAHPAGGGQLFRAKSNSPPSAAGSRR